METFFVTQLTMDSPSYESIACGTEIGLYVSFPIFIPLFVTEKYEKDNASDFGCRFSEETKNSFL